MAATWRLVISSSHQMFQEKFSTAKMTDAFINAQQEEGS